MTNSGQCGTLGKSIDKCVMMKYDTGDSKHKCVGCEPGYGPEAGDNNASCVEGESEGCYLDQFNTNGCLRCNVNAGWFSNSATLMSGTYIQTCKYYGDAAANLKSFIPVIVAVLGVLVSSLVLV